MFVVHLVHHLFYFLIVVLMIMCDFKKYAVIKRSNAYGNVPTSVKI